MKQLYAYILAPSKTYSSTSQNVLNKIIQKLKKEKIKLSFDWMKDDHPLGYVEHAKAIQALKSADMVFAEVSDPSIGVGQQISFALTNKVPILCLYRKSAEDNLSPFLRNTKSSFLYIKEYTDESIDKILSDFISNIPQKNYQKFNFVSTVEINDFLDKKSKDLGISRSDLLRNIIQDWMEKESGN